MLNRNDILRLDDAGLSAVCKLDFYKDSGPGGQKRNKTSSAVRATLAELNVSASDCTERSQARNRANALRKLRMQIAFSCRVAPAVPPERAECSLTHADYPLWTAQLLDVFFEQDLDYRNTAKVLGSSATGLLKKFYRDPGLWQYILAELSKRDLPLPHPPK